MAKTSAIVTGASSGLGLELAVLLAGGGRRIVGVSRSTPHDPRWTNLKNESVAEHVAGDVAQSATVDQAFDSRGPELDLVVNCAGTGVFGPVGDYSREDIDDVLEANLIGTILFSERAVQHFRQKGGTIVNVMSTAATIPKPNQAIYCAAKWGARGYTESLRAELKGTPVRVIGVYPGGMKTAFWTGHTFLDPATFMDPAQVARKIVDNLIDSPDHQHDLVINRPSSLPSKSTE